MSADAASDVKQDVVVDAPSDGEPTDASGPCVLSITAGAADSCAIKADRSLWCWGLHEHSTTPVEVDQDVAQVSAGYAHVCERKLDGTVWCWGSNVEGQLGDGTTNDAPSPIAVPIANAVDVSAGDHHTCAVKNDGTVWCWGVNGEGQLGDGTFQLFEPSPVQVQNIATATQVSAGSHHTCVRTEQGAWCFGFNGSGQLGNGTSGWPANAPIPVTALGADVVEVATGIAHSCARVSDGTIWCWGASGATGTEAPDAPIDPLPVRADSLPKLATQLVARTGHTCVIATDGSGWCWGSDAAGELGDGKLATSDVAVPVSLVNGTLDAIATGSSHTCAITLGRMLCWGDNTLGQLGVSLSGVPCWSEDPYFPPQSNGGSCVLAATAPFGLCP